MSANEKSRTPTIGLGAHSARGLAYFFAGSFATKLISFVCQIVLGYLLSRQDYGQYALAFTITAFIQVIEQAGVGDILVQRRNFRRWAPPGFWLALTLGTVSCLLIAIAAPVAAAWFQVQELFWLLLILAPSSIPNSLSVVPRAQLARQLKFRALATINILNLTFRLLMTVALAAIFRFTNHPQFGPLAFVIPVPVTSALTAAFLWWWVRPPWSRHLHFRRWRYLIADSARLLTAELQRVFLDQSDYVLLRAFGRPVDMIGLYWFGFMFSIQMLQLFALNLMNVLFPALTRLNDQPELQYRGFLKAQRILAMLGISSCFLQAALAEPLTHVLLDPKWIPAVGVMQILSLGMATRMVAGSSYALLKSQARFRAILWNRWGFVALQVTLLVGVLSFGGGILAVSCVVAIVASIIGPVTFYIAIRPYGGGWAAVGQILLPPLLSSGAAVGAAWAAAKLLGRAGFGYWPQLIVTLAIALPLGALFARWFLRPVWDDFWVRAWRLLPAHIAR